MSLLGRRGRRGPRNPVVTAVIGLTAIAAVLVLAVNFQRLPFLNDTSTYRASFTDASGLVVGEEVRVAGIKVGKVTAIELSGTHVSVEFTISGVDLGDETTAGIELKSLLGQHYMSLTPAGEGVLEDGGEIPLERTDTPLNIVPAFNRLTEQTNEVDTELVAEAFESLADTLSSTAPELTPALSGLSRLSTTVSSRDEEINQLLDRAARVSGVVAARDQDLAGLLTASDDVVAFLVARKETIRVIIRDTGRLARALRGLAEDNRATIGPALRKLGRVLDTLKEKADEVDEILTYAAPYAREFTNVGGTGKWFDASLKFPRGLALCSTNDSTALDGGLLDDILSQLNAVSTGSDQPCLPLNPALSSALETSGGAR